VKLSKYVKVVAIAILLPAGAALAQTTVTTSGGTANTVPLYTGSSAIGNSAITQSGNDIGIDTTSPTSFLTVSTGSDGFDPSVTYGAPAAFSFQNAGVELAGGVATASPWAYWIQSRQGSNEVWSFTINPVGGNVGIGTLSPADTFTIYHWANSSDWRTANQLFIQGDNWGGTTGSGLGAAPNKYGLEIGYQYQYASASPPNGYGGRIQAYANGVANLALDPEGGNVGIGTTTPGAKLEVDGNIKLTSGSGASITFADGSVQSTAYTGVTCGGDFAESVDITGNRAKFSPGDVLVIDPKHPGNFLKSSIPYSTSVLGVYSTKPGFVGRRLTGPKSPDEVPMAMVGIVPTKVTAENGPIHPGDLLVSSSIPGYAMKGTDRSRMLGAVIGKALGSLKSGKGVIEAGITLQ
jgi:hypothetical protein